MLIKRAPSGLLAIISQISHNDSRLCTYQTLRKASGSNYYKLEIPTLCIPIRLSDSWRDCSMALIWSIFSTFSGSLQ
jgi:hypothetical protein